MGDLAEAVAPGRGCQDWSLWLPGVTRLPSQLSREGSTVTRITGSSDVTGWRSRHRRWGTLAQKCGLYTASNFRMYHCESNICSLQKNSLFFGNYMSYVLSIQLIWPSVMGGDVLITGWKTGRGRERRRGWAADLCKPVLILPSVLRHKAHCVESTGGSRPGSPLPDSLTCPLSRSLLCMFRHHDRQCG